jgi:hypothetical protein
MQDQPQPKLSKQKFQPVQNIRILSFTMAEPAIIAQLVQPATQLVMFNLDTSYVLIMNQKNILKGLGIYFS